MFATSEWPETQVMPGTQKHPIQLDPLFSLPLRPEEWEQVKTPTRTAYANQEELCRDGDGRLYDGWTLPALALSAARSGDDGQAIRRIRQMSIASLTDAEEIQIFESSTPIFPGDMARGKCYYTTNAGLVITTLHSLVRDRFASYTAHNEPLPAARQWQTQGFSDEQPQDVEERS